VNSFLFLRLEIFNQLKEKNTLNSFCYRLIYINALICFITQNLLLFLFCFERTAIFLLILIQQNLVETRRILASYFLFFYTIIGSLPFLCRIMWNYIQTNSFTINSLIESRNSINRYYAFRRIALTFLIKLPCVGFYIWLTEAHVEAPTSGSIILARIILKIGRYGFLKIVLLNFSFRILNFAQKPLIFLFVFSFILSCLHLFTHSNLKKLIAFSSISHMNLRFLGFCCLTDKSYILIILFLATHSLIRTRLFFLRGKLKIETGQKNYQFFSGLALTSPMLSLFFSFFIFSNFNFPGTRNFFAEFLFFMNLSNYNYFLTIILRVFAGLFSICWLFFFVNIFFGQPQKIIFNRNITRSECSFLMILICCLFCFRFYPMYLFK